MHGQSYVFTSLASFQAEMADGKFLEATEVRGPHGSGMFGISFAGVSNVSATGVAFLVSAAYLLVRLFAPRTPAADTMAPSCKITAVTCSLAFS